VVKGIIFREFIDMVDKTMSEDMTEKIIAKCDLPSGGAYTTVGNYDHGEIIGLVSELSLETGRSEPELIRVFGRHLFDRFVELHGQDLGFAEDLFNFFESIDNVIHVEVKNLYPDAELPHLECARPDQDTLIVTYESARAMADLAHGLIDGAIKHFGEPISVNREDIAGGPRQRVCFTLCKK
jgi:hypothetical protein